MVLNKEEESTPDWANLDALALNLILDKLAETIDHIWFGAVCKNWSSVAKLSHQNQQFRSNVLPMLMIPTKRKRTQRSLYGIISKRVYQFQLRVQYNRRCCGSSHGWLATVNRHSVITLRNPFKNVAHIRLPPMNCGYYNPRRIENNVHKVILSTNPMTSQEFWTNICDDYVGFTDATFYKGLVYAVGRWNNIVSFNLIYSNDSSGYEQIIPNVVSPPKIEENNYAERAYLVKSLEGDLWLVRRFINRYDAYIGIRTTGTKRFEVYKLELDAQNGKLLQMLKLESLGDNVLFLGDNESISLPASCFSNCLQSDSIYFSDDFNDDEPKPYPFGPFDWGIYNVKNGSFSQHCPYKSSFRRMPPPLWVLPPYVWD
ncbi:hypothetical protein SESBI_24013 [Sesbania bispinosa]|nr:hypothetical protein SESBI_24013 [Sesbania bispinosa]